MSVEIETSESVFWLNLILATIFTNLGIFTLFNPDGWVGDHNQWSGIIPLIGGICFFIFSIIFATLIDVKNGNLKVI
jgi:hypothetical protein